jgi:hypothetical protein
MFTKISEDIRKARFTTCINEPAVSLLLLLQAANFRGERSGNKFRNLVHQTANPQICGLTKFVIFADLPHVWQFANLQFVDPIFFAIC